jgi:hypothetical protein
MKYDSKKVESSLRRFKRICEKERERGKKRKEKGEKNKERWKSKQLFSRREIENKDKNYVDLG